MSNYLLVTNVDEEVYYMENNNPTEGSMRIWGPLLAEEIVDCLFGELKCPMNDPDDDEDWGHYEQETWKVLALLEKSSVEAA